MTTDVIKNVADAAAGVVVVASWASYLPEVAAGVALLYTIMRMIIEWPKLVVTVKRWFK
jgi:hypothetical protein